MAFDSLHAVLARAPLPPEVVAHMLGATFCDYIEQRSVLHFSAASGELGPGYLVAWDWDRRTVDIQLRGETEVKTYAFTDIRDFGIAKYESPSTMGETLIATFWDARTARKHLDRVVGNAYARLAPEEVDSFEKIVNVAEAEVASLCPLDLPECEVKRRLCDIVGNPFPQKDWGGETCDILCSIRFRRKTVQAAFVLKGRAYAAQPLRIRDLGKHGDQLVRMFTLQADVFVIQSNGPIDGAVHAHMQAQIAQRLLTGAPAYYLLLDGVQTARLLRAYGAL